MTTTWRYSRGDRTAAVAGRVLAGGRGADAQRRANEVCHQHLAHPQRPAADEAGPADPQRRGRGRPGVPAGRLAAVRLQAARPGRPAGAGRRAAGRTAAGQDKPALWLLPAGGGEARRIAAPPGGVSRHRHGRRHRGAAIVVFASPVLPGASGADEDASAGRPARTRASRPSCTSRARSGTGITTSARTARACSPAEIPGRRGRGRPADSATSRRTRAGRWTRTRSRSPRTAPAWSPAGRCGTRPGTRPARSTSSTWRPGSGGPCSPRPATTSRLRASRPTAAWSPACGRSTTATRRPVTSPWWSRRWTAASPTAPRTPLLGAWTGARARRPGPRIPGSVYFTADDQGRCPVFRADLATGRGHPADRRRRRVRPPVPGAGRPLSTRCARPWTSRRPRSGWTSRRPGSAPQRLASPGSPLELPGRLEEIEATADDGARIRAWLVLPGGAGAGRARAAAALGARRPGDELERLVLAVEPVADGGQGLRGAAARPGPVHRLRAGLHRPRSRPVGRPALHRPDGDHRRGGGPARHRPGADRDDGRFLRRLHGQLDGRAHRPVPGDRQPRRAVGPGPDVRHHRPAVLLAPDLRRPGHASPSATWPTRRTATPGRSARRCW